jgi:hypothetical protein
MLMISKNQLQIFSPNNPLHHNTNHNLKYSHYKHSSNQASSFFKWFRRGVGAQVMMETKALALEREVVGALVVMQQYSFWG